MMVVLCASRYDERRVKMAKKRSKPFAVTLGRGPRFTLEQVAVMLEKQKWSVFVSDDGVQRLLVNGVPVCNFTVGAKDMQLLVGDGTVLAPLMVRVLDRLPRAR